MTDRTAYDDFRADYEKSFYMARIAIDLLATKRCTSHMVRQ